MLRLFFYTGLLGFPLRKGHDTCRYRLTQSGALEGISDIGFRSTVL